MKAKEYLEEQKFGYDHFTKKTSTGVNPDNDKIAQFAEDYHQAKLNLLNKDVVVKSLPSEEEINFIANEESQQDWNNLIYKSVYIEGFKDCAKYIKNRNKSN